MKIVYIPRGETVSYDNLATECLVVEGCLKVTYDLKAKKIIGSGSVTASSISADDIRADELSSVRVSVPVVRGLCAGKPAVGSAQLRP